MSVRHPLRLLVELVSDLVFDDDGGFNAKGLDDEDIEGTVCFHFGFYSRPKDGARGAIVKADGRGNTSFLFCWRDKQYELSLQKGECGVANAFGASTLWDKNGNIIETPGGAGTVQIGGNSHPLPLWDTFLTDFVVWVTALNTLLGTLVPGTGATGGPAYTTAIGNPASLIIKLAALANYESTKAKNG